MSATRSRQAPRSFLMDVKKLGLREAGKRDKLLRITEAARELIANQGFEATTMRQIADHAGVAVATLFLYASDKRDLLFLTCNDDLEKLTNRAFAKLSPQMSLLDQLTAAFRHFFVYYAKNRTLSRDLLRELTFYTAGQHCRRFQGIRQITIDHIRDLVEQALARGKVARGQDTDLAARAIFYLFAWQVRNWLSDDDVRPDAGVAQLRGLLATLITGIAP